MLAAPPLELRQIGARQAGPVRYRCLEDCLVIVCVRCVLPPDAKKMAKLTRLVRASCIMCAACGARESIGSSRWVRRAAGAVAGSLWPNHRRAMCREALASCRSGRLREVTIDWKWRRRVFVISSDSLGTPRPEAAVLGCGVEDVVGKGESHAKRPLYHSVGGLARCARSIRLWPCQSPQGIPLLL